MKFFGGLLIVTSLALAVVSTPLQQESGLSARASPDVIVDGGWIEERALDEGLALPRDITDSIEELQSRDTNAGIQGVEKQFAPVFSASVTVIQSFKSIVPGSTIKTIYVAQKQLTSFISSLSQACTKLTHLQPCTSKKDAQAVTLLVGTLANVVSQLLTAICGAIPIYKKLRCLYIWAPLVYWLQYVVISTIRAVIVIVKIDPRSQKAILKILASLNTDFADALEALGA